MDSFQMGEFTETAIQASGGQALVYNVAGRAVLVVMLWGGAVSPLILLETRNLVQRLATGPLARY
jgi:predicted regulator of Ras-like GTPase activity (Roadblock/LC7/MglB family)